MNFSNRVSRAFGVVASHRFPRDIQRVINAMYVRLFSIDLSEFDTIDSYETLNALFTRSLIRDREFNKEETSMISPCDSLVMAHGDAIDGRVLQIKGMEYELGELLGEDATLDSYSYLNLYLSPRDYHRYHAPCDLHVIEVRYFSGELLPVNIPSLKRNKRLFVRNERVVLKCVDFSGDILYFVAVGALNVGKMVINFEPRIDTNAKHGDAIYRYENPILLKKGQEIGHFKMGSTVVVIHKGWNLSLKEGQKVRYADTIGTKEAK